MNAILFYLIFRGKKKRSVLNSESKGKGQVMHPSRLNVNLGGGGVRPGIWQRKLARGRDFWLLPSPGGGGDFWISSD